jgi:serine/threonine-protein kinase
MSGQTELRVRLEGALASSYSIVRELGGGGMSCVFLATETALDREVVVKVLPPELAHAVSADRFRQEIRHAARLSHPHIVPLLSAGQAGDLLYYTMPFVEGESLRTRLARSGELPTREAVRLLREVADALAYAHAHGLVHRDIKPDNVLLSSGHAVVTDFGVAKALSASATGGGSGLTSLGVALGTPAYMAPEQAAAEPTTDHRADLYAWGCLAYEILTGQPPFVGRSAAALLAAHAIDTPEPVSARRPAVPPALAELVMRCLAKRPADRPQSAGELLQMLDGVMTPSGGMEPTTVVPARRPRSRAALVAASGLGIIGVVAAVAWAVAARGPPVDARRITLAPIANQTGDPALGPIAAMATTLINGGLGEIGSLDVVETPRGAALAIRGALFRRGDSLEASAQITDARTGRTLYTVGPETGALSQPRTAIDRLQQRVVGGIAMLLDESHGAPGARPARPPRWDAYREFREGDIAYYRERPDSAAARFARAVQLDSTFTLARIREGVALINGGAAYSARADSVLAQLNALRPSLSPFELSYVDLVRNWAAGDREETYLAAVRLSRLAPGSRFVAYLPGAFGTGARRWRDVVAALEPLDPASEGLRNRTFYHFHLTNALHMLGEHDRELEFAARAGRQFPSLTGIRYLEVRALAALGRVGELEERLSDYLQLPPDDRAAQPLGSALLRAAQELRAHGHPEDAGRFESWLLEWLNERSPAEKATEAIRELRALALGAAGQWPAAASVLDSLVREYPGNSLYIGRRGIVAARRGDTAGTRRADERLASMDMEKEDIRSGPTLFRARIAAVEGDRNRAVRLLRDANSQGSVFLASDDADPMIESLRGYPPFEDLRRLRE